MRWRGFLQGKAQQDRGGTHLLCHPHTHTHTHTYTQRKREKQTDRWGWGGLATYALHCPIPSVSLINSVTHLFTDTHTHTHTHTVAIRVIEMWNHILEGEADKRTIILFQVVGLFT